MKQSFATSIVLAIITAPIFVSGDARGDFTTDIQLSLVNGKIETAGGLSSYTSPLDGRVFRTAMTTRTADLFTDNPGFASLAEFLMPGEQIRFDVVRELLYWNGTQLAPAEATLTVKQFTNSITVGVGDTSGKSGLVLGGGGSTGAVHIHPEYTLPLNAPFGVYGLMITIGPAGTASFAESDPILIAFRRNAGGLNPDQGIAAMAELLTTPVPVPEPSGLGLAAGAVAAVTVIRCRRHMQKRFLCTTVANNIGLS